MTNIEKIEATLKKVADTQLVHARLMETNERKWNKRFESLQALVKNHEVRMENLERKTENVDRRIENLMRIVESHEERLEPIENLVRTMLASMDKLMKTMDDFIKGRKRQNGHR
ncbi:MAG: hypothetical protein A3G20_03460 [Acidobacteria bacterium RIFCSPLOWO2_12_FULL_59_11]|nr:MAG: hypothetical protein A3G20_03460 [Acidobacteria bacterium RIFCSPLOWO2_12_FULL_59_11]